MRVDEESEIDCTVKRGQGNINFKTGHDYCEVPTQLTQQSGGVEMGESKWVLCRHVFQNLGLELGTLTVDLLALMVSHQVAQYFCMETRYLQHSH